MEPRIRYATTADGVSIAFWTLGEGLPFVQMPRVLWSHIQLEWQISEIRRWYERLAEKRKLIRYDGRGTGLSQRDIAAISLDSMVLDLEAVVDRLGLERFALLGFHAAGPAAIAYAARHSGRISHLILWCSFSRGSDLLRSKQLEATRALLDKDWETFTETRAHVEFGWSAGELAHQFAVLMRECITQKMAQAALDARHEFDVSSLLSQVRSPTLIFHRWQLPVISLDAAKELAARIPDARLVVLEGASLAPFLDAEAVLRAIDEFLGEGEEAAAPAPAPAREAGGLVTILFTDVEGSTALTQRLGDSRAREILRQHERVTREALKAHGGTEIKTMGDGFMASFGSASRALECAIVMQRAFAAHSEEHPETPIRVRIGLNAGEPIAEEEDLFGTAVIMAARIAAKAAGGEILVANVVRELAAGKGFLFADRGEIVLRGFEDPVRLYEARWRGEG